jgi:hypothetical protein
MPPPPPDDLRNAGEAGEQGLPTLESGGARNLGLVSLGGGDAGDGAGGRRGRPVGVIGPTVKHVWVVDDMDTSKDAFLKALPKGVEAKLCGEATDKFCLEAVLQDRQLQNLVDGLEEKGWALFTKDYPQPGESEKVVLTGRNVKYVVDLVKKTD